MGYFRGKSRRILAGFVLICLALSFVLPTHHNSSKSVVLAKEEKDTSMTVVDIIAPFVWELNPLYIAEDFIPDDRTNISFLSISGLIPESEINLYQKLQTAEIIGSYQVADYKLLTLDEFLKETGLNNEGNLIQAGIRLIDQNGDSQLLGLGYRQYTDPTSTTPTEDDLYIKDAQSPYLPGDSTVLNIYGYSIVILSSYMPYTKENMEKMLGNMEFHFSSAVTDYKIDYEFHDPDPWVTSTIFEDNIGFITLYGKGGKQATVDLRYRHDARTKYEPLQIISTSGNGFEHWETWQNALHLYGKTKESDIDMGALCASLKLEFLDEEASYSVTPEGTITITGSDDTSREMTVCYNEYPAEEDTSESISCRRLSSPYVSDCCCINKRIQLTGPLPATEETIQKVLSSLHVYNTVSTSPVNHEIWLPGTEEFQINADDPETVAILKIADETGTMQPYQVYYRQDNANRYGDFKLVEATGKNIDRATVYENSPYSNSWLNLEGTLPATDENIETILNGMTLKFGQDDVTWHIGKQQDGYYIYAETSDGMSRNYKVNYSNPAPTLTPIPTTTPTPACTPEIPKNALVMRPDEVITDWTGTIEFSKQPKYPDDFDINNYKELRVFYELYTDASITDSSTLMDTLNWSNVGYTKIALNNTKTTTIDPDTGSSIYNYGFGDGLFVYYFFRLGQGSGEVRFDLTDLKETPDCISLQIASEYEDTTVRAARVKTLVFVPKDTPASPEPKASASPTVSSSPSPAAIPNLAMIGLKATVKKPNRIQLTWDANTQADYYEIYRSRKKSSGYSLCQKVKAPICSYLDKPVTKTTTWYYKIRAVCNKYGTTQKGIFSSPVKKTIRPLQTPSISVKKKSRKKMKFLTIQLKKYEGTHLDVYVRTKKKYNKLILTTSRIKPNKKGINIRYMSKGKTYRIRIRTWKKHQGKKLYSSYSNTVTIRT